MFYEVVESRHVERLVEYLAKEGKLRETEEIVAKFAKLKRDVYTT